MVLLAGGCGGPVPEEEIGPPRMDLPGITSSTAQTVEESPKSLSWKLPEGWIERDPGSAMRLMEAAAPGPVEIVIFFFGEGQGGSVESNFERWRSQVDPTADPVETSLDTNGLKISILDQSGTLRPSPMAGVTEPRPGSRMIAAVIEGEGGPWFFRATGPASALAEREPEIVAFLQSLAPSR